MSAKKCRKQAESREFLREVHSKNRGSRCGGAGSRASKQFGRVCVMAKISVIVPLYNVESYVEKAAKSLIQQSFDGLEVVLVDDGSSDNSLETMRNRLRSLDVKAIRQENKGPGGARNTGILAASGEYVVFLDADDFFLPGALRNILSTSESEKPDVLFGRIHLWTEDKGLVRTKCPAKPPPADTRSQTEYILGGQREAAWCPVRYIFRREFVLRHEVFFATHMLCEDVKWVVDLLMAVEQQSGKIAFLQEPFYAYFNRRPGSTMNTYSVKRLVDLNTIVLELLEKLPDRPAICRALVWESFYYINEYCLFDKDERMQILKPYRDVLPKYRFTDIWYIRLAGKCQNAALFYAMSLGMYTVRMARRAIMHLLWVLKGRPRVEVCTFEA